MINNIAIAVVVIGFGYVIFTFFHSVIEKPRSIVVDNLTMVELKEHALDSFKRSQMPASAWDAFWSGYMCSYRDMRFGDQ